LGEVIATWRLAAGGSPAAVSFVESRQWATMAKQPTKQHLHSWAVYHIKGTPAKLVGIVYDQPDADSAIKQAIEEYERDRLIALLRRD
jgi:hypothetical protein